LEVNPRWDMVIPAYGDRSITFDLSLASSSGVDLSDDGLTRHRLVILPNPSRGMVSLRLMAVSPGRFSTSIFNLSGQLIRQMDFDGDSGPHILSWDGRNQVGEPVASGIYVIEVRHSASHTTGKVTIVR
jgi:hypothetical protein